MRFRPPTHRGRGRGRGKHSVLSYSDPDDNVPFPREKECAYPIDHTITPVSYLQFSSLSSPFPFISQCGSAGSESANNRDTHKPPPPPPLSTLTHMHTSHTKQQRRPKLMCSSNITYLSQTASTSPHHHLTHNNNNNNGRTKHPRAMVLRRPHRNTCMDHSSSANKRPRAMPNRHALPTLLQPRQRLAEATVLAPGHHFPVLRPAQPGLHVPHLLHEPLLTESGGEQLPREDGRLCLVDCVFRCFAIGESFFFAREWGGGGGGLMCGVIILLLCRYCRPSLLCPFSGRR